MGFRAVQAPESPDGRSPIIIQRADQPNVVVHFFDADGLPGKDRAEINFLPADADATAMRDHTRFVLELRERRPLQHCPLLSSHAFPFRRSEAILLGESL